MTVETREPCDLEIRLFGTFDARLKERPLPRLRYRKEQWLLALLALRHDHDVPRDWLAATFWPDNEESQALFYLRKALSNLRKALGDEAGRLLSPTSRTVRFDLEGAFADVLAFDAAIKKGMREEGKGKSKVAFHPSLSHGSALEAAVALYRGPLLQDCQEEWVFHERNGREQSYLAALERLAAICQERGEPASSVRWLRLLVAADPYRESAYTALMQALADSGDRAAMEQVYQELRLALRRDLNADPAPETDALYRILRARPPQPVVLPPTSSGPSGPPRRLPVPLSDLIGREVELEEICGWVSRNRLVTLVGAGGVGKTRLSIAVAERVIEQFAEGVWFADLAPLKEAAQIPATLLRLFGLPEDPQNPPEQSLEQALSSRNLLLVLDNCEHLLEACALLAHHLLSACPGLRMLATSREALGFAGEHLYRVPSLSLPPPGQTGVEKETSSLLEYPAVRLFVERARQANASFQLNRGNAGTVAQICQRLDGIPLALELAAARVRSLSLAQIAARLEDRFHLLTGGSRVALPRQRTLQAAIDWSYDLLSEAERILFRRLSVFAGSWSLEAAEAICDFGFWILDVQLENEADAPDSGDTQPAVPIENHNSQSENPAVLDMLTRLVEKSLVVFEEDAEGMGRYRLLETMRQYGGERLTESGEAKALRSRHCDFTLNWVEEAEPHFYGPEQSAWYASIEREYDNLRAALEWCQQEKSAEKALRLTGAMSPFWDVRGYYKEGLAHQIAALSMKEAAGTEARAKALFAAGQFSVRRGDYAGGYAQARSLLEECLAIQQELGNRRGVIGALTELANVALQLGDHAQVRSYCEESLAIAQELGDKRSAIGAFNLLGHLSIGAGDHTQARSFYEACLAIQRESGDTRGIAGSLRGLGNVAEAQGDYAQARSLLEECLEISQKLGDKFGIAAALIKLGELAWKEGDYGRVHSYCEESLAIYQELGDKLSALHTLGFFGHIARAAGDYSRAGALYQKSLALRRELGETRAIVQSLEDFAALAGRQGLPERAARLLGAAEALYQTLDGTPPACMPEEYARAIDIARAALGEEAFAAAWEKGRAMSLEQIIEYALA